jgi:hypothetical protein
VESPISAQLCSAPALPTYIRLGWKSTEVVNNLAYYDTSIITTVKYFIVQAPELRYGNNYGTEKFYAYTDKNAIRVVEGKAKSLP